MVQMVQMVQMAGKKYHHATKTPETIWNLKFDQDGFVR